jgi:branched-subunit amino acid transport protein AzlD
MIWNDPPQLEAIAWLASVHYNTFCTLAIILTRSVPAHALNNHTNANDFVGFVGERKLYSSLIILFVHMFWKCFNNMHNCGLESDHRQLTLSYLTTKQFPEGHMQQTNSLKTLCATNTAWKWQF